MIVTLLCPVRPPLQRQLPLRGRLLRRLLRGGHDGRAGGERAPVRLLRGVRRLHDVQVRGVSPHRGAALPTGIQIV